MSMASECDLCGALFKGAIGDVTIIELGVRDHEGNCETWSELDFCATCSAKVLGIIRPALDGPVPGEV